MKNNFIIIAAALFVSGQYNCMAQVNSKNKNPAEINIQDLSGFTLNLPVWLTNGNSGTNPATNFLGTKDNKPLVFRTSNMERIRITSTGGVGIGTTAPKQKLDVQGNINIIKGSGLYIDNTRTLFAKGDNFFSGPLAGISISSGRENTAVGFHTMATNTTGNVNTAVGAYAMYSNTEGTFNSAFGGGGVLYFNTTGSVNTGLGVGALHLNTTGHDNMGAGFNALYANVSGYNNMAVGNYALSGNTTGFGNSASGYGALLSNSMGNNNTADGYNALTANSYADNNTASGAYSLFTNTTGGENTAGGFSALFSNNEGSLNTAFGSRTLYNNTADQNTAIGYASLFNTSYGPANTAIGFGSLYSNKTGAGLTAIGFGADITIPDNIINSTAIGSLALITASNQVRIGNMFVTSIGGYTNWSNVSDKRVKKNIKENVPGLAFINKLKPITYTLDMDAIGNFSQAQAAVSGNNKAAMRSAMEITSQNIKAQVIYSGFIAQDVEKAAKEIAYDFSGVDAAKNEKDLYGLRYAEFVVPLVKAVQELSAENEALKARLDKLEQIINSGKTTGSLISGGIDQNMPNPFHDNTMIRYYLPPKTNNAFINITDKAGKLVKTFPLTKGSGQLLIRTDRFAAGTYQYSLLIDGKLIDTKQMIIIK